MGAIIPELYTAISDEDYEIAKNLFLEYADELNINLDFQDFDEELESIKDQYQRPNGGIIFLKINDMVFGCVGIRKFESNICELKRMYIKKQYRGKGFGQQLLNSAINLAKSLNYNKIRLDTLPTMKEASHIYKKSGFYEIEQYRYNPVSGTKYFELDIM